MNDPQIVIIKDTNDSNDIQITVYVDGKQTDVKVLHWASDDEWPSLLAPHVFVTCYGEDGCADDYHVVLPDQWSEEEWEKLTAAEGGMVP